MTAFAFYRDISLRTTLPIPSKGVQLRIRHSFEIVFQSLSTVSSRQFLVVQREIICTHITGIFLVESSFVLCIMMVPTIELICR